MAKQRYINTRFWRDSYITELDPTEKLLFIYFLSNPDTNISGVYEIPLKIISADTGIDSEMVKKILKRFENDGRIKYEKGWIAIRNFTLHQTISPKIKIGIETELNNAPDFMINWLNINEKIGYVRPIQGLSHLNTNTNTNTNEKNNTLKEPKGSAHKKTEYSEDTLLLYSKLYEQRKSDGTLPITAKDKAIFFKNEKMWVCEILKQSSVAEIGAVMKFAKNDNFLGKLPLTFSKYSMYKSAYNKGR